MSCYDLVYFLIFNFLFAVFPQLFLSHFDIIFSDSLLERISISFLIKSNSNFFYFINIYLYSYLIANKLLT